MKTVKRFGLAFIRFLEELFPYLSLHGGRKTYLRGLTQEWELVFRDGFDRSDIAKRVDRWNRRYVKAPLALGFAGFILLFFCTSVVWVSDPVDEATLISFCSGLILAGVLLVLVKTPTNNSSAVIQQILQDSTVRKYAVPSRITRLADNEDGFEVIWVSSNPDDFEASRRELEDAILDAKDACTLVKPALRIPDGGSHVVTASSREGRGTGVAASSAPHGVPGTVPLNRSGVVPLPRGGTPIPPLPDFTGSPAGADLPEWPSAPIRERYEEGEARGFGYGYGTDDTDAPTEDTDALTEDTDAPAETPAETPVEDVQVSEVEPVEDERQDGTEDASAEFSPEEPADGVPVQPEPSGGVSLRSAVTPADAPESERPAKEGSSFWSKFSG